MASEADRLQAARLFIDEGLGATAIAIRIGVARKTVYNWRDADDWEVRRAEALHRVTQALHAATHAAEHQVATSAAVGRMLTHARRREILLELAEDLNLEPRDRIAALKLDATLDPLPSAGGVDAADGEGPPNRVVIRRGKPTGSLDA